MTQVKFRDIKLDQVFRDPDDGKVYIKKCANTAERWNKPGLIVTFTPNWVVVPCG
jgi:hypothetical protein